MPADLRTARPGSIVEWFTLRQRHRLIGLILLDRFDLIHFGPVGLIILALCAALRQGRRSSPSVTGVRGKAKASTTVFGS